jgi:hypothetical protein
MLTCGIEVQFFPKSLVWDTNFLVSWRKKLVSRGDIDLIRELWWLLDVSLSQKSYARHVHIICRIVHHPIWLAIVPITDGKHPTVGAALEVFPLENQKKIFLVPNMQKKNETKKMSGRSQQNISDNSKIAYFWFWWWQPKCTSRSILRNAAIAFSRI